MQKLRFFLPTLLWLAFTSVECVLRRAEPAYWNAEFARYFYASLAVSFGLFHLAVAAFAFLLGKYPRAALGPVYLFGALLTTTLAYGDVLRAAGLPLPTPTRLAAAVVAGRPLAAFSVPAASPFLWGAVLGFAVFGSVLFLRTVLSVTSVQKRDRAILGFVALLGTLTLLVGAPIVNDGGLTEFLPMVGEIHALRVVRLSNRLRTP
jgi:hypothetical protein